jgi:hypothetical protein
MLVFERISNRERDRIEFDPKQLIVAGWTGRDEAIVNHHIEELAAIGVPRPSSVPVFYRNGIGNLTQAARIEVFAVISRPSEAQNCVAYCSYNVCCTIS